MKLTSKQLRALILQEAGKKKAPVAAEPEWDWGPSEPNSLLSQATQDDVESAQNAAQELDKLEYFFSDMQDEYDAVWYRLGELMKDPTLVGDDE